MQKQYADPLANPDLRATSPSNGLLFLNAEANLGMSHPPNLHYRLAGDMAATFAPPASSHRTSRRRPTRATKHVRRRSTVSKRVNDAPSHHSFKPSSKFLMILKELTEGDHERIVAKRLNVTRQYVVMVRQQMEEAGFFPHKPHLSRKERGRRHAKIAKLAKRGLPPGKIARQLELSQGYVEHICRKLGISGSRPRVRGLSESGRQRRLTARCFAELILGVPPAKIRRGHKVTDHYLTGLREIAREEGLVMQAPGCKLSGEAIRFIRMSLQYLSPEKAARAFGITERTARRISKTRLTDHPL
jgi:DNA-binding MarR family transcriptional regulator